MFEEQYKKANEGLENMTTSRKQDESFESRFMLSPGLNRMPLGYKHQLAAQTIQKYLKSFLTRKHMKKWLNSRKSEQNKYKRLNVSCDFCQERFSNQNSLYKHQSFMHQGTIKNENSVKEFSMENQQQQIPQFQNSRQQNHSQQFLTNQSQKESSVHKFQLQYEQETDKMHSQLSTPFRKIRVTKKQYQNWSDKILNQYRSIVAERQSPINSSQDISISQFQQQKQDVSSFCDQIKVDGLGYKSMQEFNKYQSLNIPSMNKASNNDYDQDVEAKASSLNNCSKSLFQEYRIRQMNQNSHRQINKNSHNASPSLDEMHIHFLQQSESKDNKGRADNFESITSIKNFSNMKRLENSSKKALNFTPKSHRLNQPMIYGFDIYVRAATEIQRYFRGYLARKKISGSFKLLRTKIIKIQRAVRGFLTKTQIKHEKYLEFLELKSKRILHDLKNFYKIYQKLDKKPSQSQSRKSALSLKAEKHKMRLEKGYQQIRHKIHKFAQDKSIQTQSQSSQQMAVTTGIGNFSPNSQVETDLGKDHMIQSLKSEVRALKLMLYRDITSTINFNSQSIEPRDSQYQLQSEENEYRSLQVLKERLANLQKTHYEELL